MDKARNLTSEFQKNTKVQEGNVQNIAFDHRRKYTTEYEVTHFENFLTREDFFEKWNSLPDNLVNRRTFKSKMQKQLTIFEENGKNLKIPEIKKYNTIAFQNEPKVVHQCNDVISNFTEKFNQLDLTKGPRLNELKYSSLHKKLRVNQVRSCFPYVIK